MTKAYDSPAAAVGDVPTGSTILISGASAATEPSSLLAALADSGVGGLTCVCDFSDCQPDSMVAALVASGQITRIISPNPPDDLVPGADASRLTSSGLAVEEVPQGTLAERLRAGGAGIGGVLIPVGAGTRFATGKEVRVIDGVECVLELPLRADFALIRGSVADTLGNVVYQGNQRAWSATMAAAARVCVVEVDTVGEPGIIDPELVITPGIFVNRVVQTTRAT